MICQVLGQHEIEFIKKPRPFPFFPGDESEFPTPDDPDSDGVIGAAGKHYPTLRSPPPTSFVCDGRLPGMYADMETGCQVSDSHTTNICVGQLVRKGNRQNIKPEISKL